MKSRKSPSPVLKRLRLRQLDQRLAPWLPLRRVPVPRNGWIQAVRQALGIGITQLARRLGAKPPTVVEFEKRETEGTITLNSLRRVAEAMDCRLVYALVPNTTLEIIVRDQAVRKARAYRGQVSHSMALEAQGVDADEAERQERELVHRLMLEWPRTLWDDDDHHADSTSPQRHA